MILPILALQYVNPHTVEDEWRHCGKGRQIAICQDVYREIVRLIQLAFDHAKSTSVPITDITVVTYTLHPNFACVMGGWGGKGYTVGDLCKWFGENFGSGVYFHVVGYFDGFAIYFSTSREYRLSEHATVHEVMTTSERLPEELKEQLPAYLSNW